jgi:hypothetical protein
MATSHRGYIIDFMFKRRPVMRFGFLLAAIGFAVANGPAVGLADDIYVNNVTGDDRYNGKLAADATINSGAVRTIARALELARSGDRILVEKTDRPYNESLTLQGARHSGTDVMPFTILSDGATLDGTSSVDPWAWDHVRGNVFRFRPHLKSFQQLYLDGRPAERVAAVAGRAGPSLQPRQWALLGGWVYFCTEGNKIPTEYDLRYCRYQTGITLYDVHDVVIDGLIVQGFQLDGINAHDGVSGTEIRNCKLRGNGRSGLSAGGASHVQLRSSVVGANGSAQVRSEGYCTLHLQDCRLLEAPDSGQVLEQDGGRISVDGRVYQGSISTLRR